MATLLAPRLGPGIFPGKQVGADPFERRLSATEYLRIMQDDPDAIHTVRVVPGILGSPRQGFGYLVVILRRAPSLR